MEKSRKPQQTLTPFMLTMILIAIIFVLFVATHVEVLGSAAPYWTKTEAGPKFDFAAYLENLGGTYVGETKGHPERGCRYSTIYFGLNGDTTGEIQTCYFNGELTSSRLTVYHGDERYLESTLFEDDFSDTLVKSSEEEIVLTRDLFETFIRLCLTFSA